MCPTALTALVRVNNAPVIVCSEIEPEQPLKLRKILFTHNELNALMAAVQAEVQSCQQALNDENDKRDMYKVSIKNNYRNKLTSVKLLLNSIQSRILSNNK